MLNAHIKFTHTNKQHKNKKKRKTSITAVYNHFKTTKLIYRGTSIGIAFTVRYNQIKTHSYLYLIIRSTIQRENADY